MMEKIAQTYTLDLQQSMSQLSSHLDHSFSLTQGSTIANNKEAEAPEISKEDVREFFRTLQKKEDELKEGLKSHKQKSRAQEEEFNTALQELIGNRNSFEKGTIDRRLDPARCGSYQSITNPGLSPVSD